MTADDWFGMPKEPRRPSPNSNRSMMYACTASSAVYFALLVTQHHPIYFAGSVGFAALSYVYWARN